MASKQFPHPFNSVKKDYSAFRRQLTVDVSKIAAKEFKDNFTNSGYRGDFGFEAWKPRQKQIKGKNYKTLQITGRLKRGIREAAFGDFARVVNSVPYAKIHNEGGTITRRSSSELFVRNRISKGKKKGRFKKGTSVGRGFTRKAGTINMPARPFMKGGKPLYNDINKFIDKQFQNIWRKAK